ncbi:hypothetical protein Ple7327_4516 [Pleurocapsa sp. PCC 7327]|uniref:hypothetical protein n=1 Tax=Pleurocapsa sp. PCC 7327 TaxID=118163 RepID=UPI00029FFB92|nr:hypothetical protein [Pleurocapsa sp. PCC 7327]AFY79616.1 hypothetical protein Ple7327_4516 [Pleurocapsa sp. PCC 7327]
MNTFLSGVAVLLSVIALAGAGFALTQMFQLQQSFRELNDFVQSSPTVSETESDQQANTEIQPGQFVQYAFKDRAQVELLSVKRIQNPDDGQRNIVNVQVRVRNLKGGVTHIISPDQTIARNPKTNERYESYDYVIMWLTRRQENRLGGTVRR